MGLKILQDLNVRGRSVFLRVDFNVPLTQEGKILDDTRIQEALPTIRYLLGQQARLVLASHLGRPKGRHDPQQSLLPVGEHLSEILKQEVIFPEDCIGDAVKKLIHDIREGQILLLENLRFHPEEEQNDPEFSKKLASLAEVYITDAFGSLHRAHASTVGMTSYFKEKGIGLLVQKELEILQKILKSPERPFYAVLGGAKVSDKIGVIENLLGRIDGLFLGGALAYTFLKARGESIGRSRFEEEKLYFAKKVLKLAEEKGIAVYLPIDHKVVTEIQVGGQSEFQVVRLIPPDKIGVDIGPATIQKYQERLAKGRTIFWNGPMGIFEEPLFAEGTRQIAASIAKPGITSVVGGGESVTACRQAGVGEQITHLSTGGGAMLEFVEGKLLPGLKALES
ncbi:MAG: phosphoglycerate kinase [Deltaproteobacteria bacterium]|nr:phosphoglycerate kinase [Deltaproteobacteria bacterium]MBI2499871.1 phosphoglycerate kinase [Deltaproteobacteria bacterium]MBI4197446.1 phosphoglycerate kinase [Deltaproteobacteria bacterium]